jgi:hypothetical protein
MFVKLECLLLYKKQLQLLKKIGAGNNRNIYQQKQPRSTWQQLKGIIRSRDVLECDILVSFVVLEEFFKMTQKPVFIERKHTLHCQEGLLAKYGC